MPALPECPRRHALKLSREEIGGEGGEASLALADSPNRHEAESAMAAAHRLMLRHRIESSAGGPSRDYSFVDFGRPAGRVFEHDRLVAMILGKYLSK